MFAALLPQFAALLASAALYLIHRHTLVFAAYSPWSLRAVYISGTVILGFVFSFVAGPPAPTAVLQAFGSAWLALGMFHLGQRSK